MGGKMDPTVVSPSSLPCDDFLQFVRMLGTWRKTDDRIRNEMDYRLPTTSFQSKSDCPKICKSIMSQMLESHKNRNDAIRHSLAHTSGKVDKIKRSQAEAGDEEGHKMLRDLKRQQAVLRQYQSELLEEEVIQTSTTKVL